MYLSGSQQILGALLWNTVLAWLSSWEFSPALAQPLKYELRPLDGTLGSWFDHVNVNVNDLLQIPTITRLFFCKKKKKKY